LYTHRQTKSGKNITSLAEVIRFLLELRNWCNATNANATDVTTLLFNYVLAVVSATFIVFVAFVYFVACFLVFVAYIACFALDGNYALSTVVV